MTQYGFYFDSTRCTGCKTCELSCKDYKDLSTEVLFRRIYDYEGGSWAQGEGGSWTSSAFVYHVSVACNHCDLPACVANCPTGAMQKDTKTGIVNVDSEVCIGCGTCATACPYSAPCIDSQMGISRKCDGCIDRVGEGLQPVCVNSCPMRCLEFDDVEELRSKYGELAQMLPLPEPSETSPNLVLKPCPALESPDSLTGFVANELEVV